MQYRDCNSVSDVMNEAFDLIRCDRLRFEKDEVSYYFRGENRNFKSQNAIPNYMTKPGIYRNEGFIEHESDFFNEVLRTYPDEFSRDKTTFEILTRMQHYQYPTRLLDVSSKLTTAIGFAAMNGYDGNDYGNENGFIHVYRVNTKRIKYGTSDTVTALSNLARLKRDHVTFDEEGLRYLGAECKNERAGFYVEEGSKVTTALRRDLKKVFCVKPMVNNIRINFQLGEFFLFGCNENKECLDATFDEGDYDNPSSATEGIAQIGMIILTPKVKGEAREMSDFLDIGLHRLYSDFFIILLGLKRFTKRGKTMKYETIGYVKSIKASTNPEVLEMGFMPVGAYLFEDNGECCCVYRETGTQNAKLVKIEKGRLLNPQVKCKIQLKLMLILAKANNAKIKIEVTCEGDSEPKPPLAITAVEYV